MKEALRFLGLLALCVGLALVGTLVCAVWFDMFQWFGP